MRGLMFHHLHACCENSHYVHCPLLAVQLKDWEFSYLFPFDLQALALPSAQTLKLVRGNERCFSTCWSAKPGWQTTADVAA